MPAQLLGQTPAEPSVTDEVNISVYTHKAAFLVLVDNNGNYVFEPDINKPVIPERAPTAVEIKGALRTILEDIRMQEQAVVTINMQMQAARQMQEQAMNQQVLQQMGSQRK